jgi:hypothetical protein
MYSGECARSDISSSQRKEKTAYVFTFHPRAIAYHRHEIIPVEEEEDDLDTLALVQRVHTALQQNLSGLDEYTVSTVPTDERNIDVILLLTLVSTAIVASKDLLTSIFNMITAILELLAKKDHVQEIEIIADGKTVILRDLKKKPTGCATRY